MKIFNLLLSFVMLSYFSYGCIIPHDPSWETDYDLSQLTPDRTSVNPTSKYTWLGK